MDISNQINNIYQQPDDFEKTLFHRSNRDIARIIKNHAYNICKNTIPQAYINNSINRFNRGYVYKVNNLIIGFIIWEIKNKNINTYKNTNLYTGSELHILLICANTNNRFGTQLLYDVEEYALSQGINIITLIPANDELVKFYKKNGFKMVSQYPQPLMLKNIEVLKIKRTRKTLRKSLRSDLKNKTQLVDIQDNSNLLIEQID